MSDVIQNGGTAPGDASTLTKKDFTSDQEPRWCPGCGDYAILSAVQGFMPELGIEPHKTVFVSGIGCSGRFTYYMDTYGMHGIHGLLLFNNQIYGLTKGQYSPTSEEGKVTKSTPFGSIDHPFNPIAAALGVEGTFVARTIDNDRQHLTEVLRRAAQHKGTAFVEIYQNCNVFNDGAFDLLREKSQGKHNQIRLQHGQPIVFDEGNRCVRVGENGRYEIAAIADTAPDSIVVHDAHGRPSLAFALAHLSHGPDEPSCIGVFHEVERPVYGQAIQHQLQSATERLGKGDLGKLLGSGDTWVVE